MGVFPADGPAGLPDPPIGSRQAGNTVHFESGRTKSSRGPCNNACMPVPLPPQEARWLRRFLRGNAFRFTVVVICILVALSDYFPFGSGVKIKPFYHLSRNRNPENPLSSEDSHPSYALFSTVTSNSTSALSPEDSLTSGTFQSSTDTNPTYPSSSMGTNPTYPSSSTSSTSSSSNSSSQSTVPLSLEEDNDCILTAGVLPNVPVAKTLRSLPAQSWVYHKDNEVLVEGVLAANQPEFLSTEGTGEQFFLEFKIPDDIFRSGEAKLSIYLSDKSYGDCYYHELEITRMPDNTFRKARDDSKATTDKVTLQMGDTMQYHDVDISTLIYGKDLKDKTLYLMFKERNAQCSSTYHSPKEEYPPKLTINTVDATPADAVYDEWSPFSKCRVSCNSSVNYQCRKRNCIAGVSTGKPCTAEKMLEKRPCSDTAITERCTCQHLKEQQACPTNAECSETDSSGARCMCSSTFSREDFTKKTVCGPTRESASGPVVDFAAGSTAGPTENTNGSSNNKLWIALGICGGAILLCGVILVLTKPKPRGDACAQSAGGLPPGQYWPQEGGGPPPIPQVALSPGLGAAPMPPGTRPMGPPRMF